MNQIVPPIHYNSTLAPVEHADLMLTQIISAAESARRAIAAMEGVRLTDSSSRQEVAQNGDNVSPSHPSEMLLDRQALSALKHTLTVALRTKNEIEDIWPLLLPYLRTTVPVSVSLSKCVSAKFEAAKVQKMGFDGNMSDCPFEEVKEQMIIETKAVLDAAGVPYVD